ncbi:MAG TPA: glutamyl-tRNA reductase [Polyangia bacterium]|jgi:glutamyl-tRNA reductase
MPGGIDFLVLGLSHKTAPLDVRERLASPPDQIGEALRAFARLETVREVALLSTCNRVEIYLASPDPDAAIAALRRHLAERAGISELDIAKHLYARVDVDAVHHLFRVAASLDSLVIGEPQILGQVKQAHDDAVTHETAGALLGACFSGAFRIARRVRRETEIARNPVSISSVSIEFARKIFDGFAGRSVLLVGAGKMADLAARALRGHGATLRVTNRTAARADELAARIGGAETHPFEDLLGALVQADIVIASTGAQRPVLTRALIEAAQKKRRGRLLFLIDIAVPRDVEPSAAQVANVFLADIDDLQKLADEHRDGRRGQADRAEAMVEQEVARFLEAFRGRRVGPTITALRDRVLETARAEAERAVAGLSGLGEREQRAMFELAEAIAKKLLHRPQVALKKGGGDPVDGAALVSAAQRLFDLEVTDDGAPAALGSRDDDGDDGEAEQSTARLSGKAAGR